MAKNDNAHSIRLLDFAGGVMLNTDYKIEAIKLLLNEDCILKRYYSLIPYKDILVENLGLKVPLMKEVKTHIAVAGAFTDILIG